MDLEAERVKNDREEREKERQERNAERALMHKQLDCMMNMLNNKDN